VRRPPEYGETWAYESIIGALPGVNISRRAAIAIQLLVFEVALLGLAWYYALPDIIVPGTAAVAVAAAGSAEMLRISGAARAPETPEAYRRLLFGSSVEVVLSVLAFIAFVTHLFVFDPGGGPLVERLFGTRPPTLVVYLTLLVMWDLCYRLGTGWWAAIVALWRSATYRFDPDTAATLRRADRETLLFGVIQLVLVPFILDFPVLLAALIGHVTAVFVVTTASLALLRWRETG
jgi:hypothetical protein